MYSCISGHPERTVFPATDTRKSIYPTPPNVYEPPKIMSTPKSETLAKMAWACDILPAAELEVEMHATRRVISILCLLPKVKFLFFYCAVRFLSFSASYA